MSSMGLLGVLLGGAFALGLIVMVAAWRGVDLLPKGGQRRATPADPAARRRLLIAIGVALVVGVVTRWPVAAVSAGALVVLWPRLFGGAAAGEHEVERTEALAVWIESLRDTVAGNMSLEQAIPSTVDAAPALLTDDLERLVGMLQARLPLTEALARFAEELNDAAADLVVAALILNAAQRGPGLEAALSELAQHARGELELRQRVEAGRKPLRRAAWVIVGFTLSFVAALAVFARDYVAPYNSPVGQVVLAAVIGLFATSFAWARKVSEYVAPDRFLASPEELERSQLTGARR